MLGTINKQLEVEAKGVPQPITLYEVRGIGGTYNLVLPERDDRLVPLRQHLPLTFTMLEGERLSHITYTGHFIQLSARGGEVHTSHAITPWSNVKLRLLGHNGKVLPGDIYAKILRHLSGSHAGFYAHFTSVSPEAAMVLQGVLG